MLVPTPDATVAMLLQLDESRFSGRRPRRRSAIDVFWRVWGIRRVHPGLRRARGALVRAPQIRKVERVAADRGHFFEMNRNAVGKGSAHPLTGSLTILAGSSQVPVGGVLRNTVTARYTKLQRALPQTGRISLVHLYCCCRCCCCHTRRKITDL